MMLAGELSSTPDPETAEALEALRAGQHTHEHS